MKKLSLLLSLCSLGFVTNGCFAGEWLKGVYVNQDGSSLMDEAIFCDSGKVYAGMAPRLYQIEVKDDGNYVVLNSNGKFTFKISDDRTELFPADGFTSKWFTETSLKLDPKRNDTCNW